MVYNHRPHSRTPGNKGGSHVTNEKGSKKKFLIQGGETTFKAGAPLTKVCNEMAFKCRRRWENKKFEVNGIEWPTTKGTQEIKKRVERGVLKGGQLGKIFHRRELQYGKNLVNQKENQVPKKKMRRLPGGKKMRAGRGKEKRAGLKFIHNYKPRE